MTFFVLGDADDVAGFALAGVEGAVCETRSAVEKTLRELSARPRMPAVLLVSPSVARLAGRALDGLFDPDRPPHALPLPEAPVPPGRPEGGPP